MNKNIITKQEYEYIEHIFREDWKEVARLGIINTLNHFNYPIPNSCWACYIEHIGQKFTFGNVSTCLLCPLQDRAFHQQQDYPYCHLYHEKWKTAIMEGNTKKQIINAYKVSQIPWYTYNEWRDIITYTEYLYTEKYQYHNNYKDVYHDLIEWGECNIIWL